ncbi:MAG: diflavin flavoprotein [Spirulinaceae cyanobacterium]
MITPAQNLPNSSQSDRLRDVQVQEIATQTWVLRSRTWDRLKFEVEYARELGTTANAYLIRAEQTVLIDPPGASFSQLFIEALSQTGAMTEITSVIAQHVNPNRIVTLQLLLAQMPQAMIVCSKPAAIALKQARPDWGDRIQVVRGGDTLTIGPNHTLQFSFVPSPRWADGICTYDHHTQILFTDKLFGAHLCGHDLWDADWKKIQADRRYYFDCLFAPQAKQTKEALARIADYPARIYGPGHGPLIRYSLSRLATEYEQWCAEQDQQSLRVALLYASAYGNTLTAADAIAQGLIQEGIQVEGINCEAVEPQVLETLLDECDGIIIGSPTLGGHAPMQIQMALGLILTTATKRKLVGVFGSYGWSGEAIDLIENKLKDANFQFGFETLRIRFSPTPDVLETCVESGVTFAKALQKNQKARGFARPLVTANVDRTAQAMGRVVGSLCVLTYQTSEGYRSLLTSWVTQASFSPPGIVVAIANREGLAEVIEPGSSFLLNLLQDGKNLRQYFSRDYIKDPTASPTVETSRTEQGGLILTDAVAYLECSTSKRTLCGDRWLLYATVNQGEVLDAAGQTAIYYRASGREE